MTADGQTEHGTGPVRWSLWGLLVSPVVLVALLAVDLALVVASTVVDSPGTGPGDGALSLESDGGLVEYVGYLHHLVLVVALLTVARLGGSRVWTAWAAVFALVLADDSARLHETLGDRFADALGFPAEVAGLRADDLGELVVWGLLAAVPLAWLVVLHRRSDRPTREASLRLAVPVAVYAFFGVVVDQVHAMARDGAWAGLLGTLEDGGELVALGVTVAHVVTLVGAARLGVTPRDGDAAGQAPEARASASASSSPA